MQIGVPNTHYRAMWALPVRPLQLYYFTTRTNRFLFFVLFSRKKTIQIECIENIALICYKLIVNWQFWLDLLHNLMAFFSQRIFSLRRFSLPFIYCIFYSYRNANGTRAMISFFLLFFAVEFMPYYILAVSHWKPY